MMTLKVLLTAIHNHNFELQLRLFLGPQGRRDSGAEGTLKVPKKAKVTDPPTDRHIGYVYIVREI